jgi:hypothetical protein
MLASTVFKVGDMMSADLPARQQQLSRVIISSGCCLPVLLMLPVLLPRLGMLSGLG